MSMDPAALQVLISRLTGVGEEMGAVLRRAAFSPNIKERADCSAALFTADGELLVQAEHIPVHLGSMPASVRAAIDAFGERLGPGDQVAVNDPFCGGTHLNDLTLVAGCWVDGRLIGWAANRAHHADVGGMAPGSIPAAAVEVHQEGLRIPPVLLTDEVEALLCANSRTPEERRGDLDAQRGANVVGLERLAQFAGAPLHEITDYGERRMRAALADMPDGTWRFEDQLDSCGPEEDQQEPARVVVALTVDGDTATFDFEGTDPQRRGNVNAVEAVTVSAVSFALRSAADPTIPANGGAMRPVTIRAPEGTIVNARPPAAVGAGNVEVSARVADVCLGALAQAVPGRVGAASQGTMNNTLLGGPGNGGSVPERSAGSVPERSAGSVPERSAGSVPERRAGSVPERRGGSVPERRGGWVYYETVAGGQGGRPGREGMSGVHTGMTNSKNTPVEALERAFPLRVRRYRLRRGSGGEGRWPGGDGIERDLEVLDDATVSLITERRTSRPWGLEGGGPGAAGENWLLPGGDESRARRLPDKCTLSLRPGDVVRMLTPGGGGYGEPEAT